LGCEGHNVWLKANHALGGCNTVKILPARLG
jgi:hypothetical protein